MTRNGWLQLLTIGGLSLLVVSFVLYTRITDPSPQISESVGQDVSTATNPDTPVVSSTPSISPTAVPPGDLISVPAAVFENRDIMLVAAEGPPLISQEEAMQAVYDAGVPWGLGGEWDGKPVTVTGHYGLATFGYPGPKGGWIGDQNIPLPDGSLLDHIENRPMWIITYSNTPFYGAGCPECPPPPDYNNTVAAVDAETRQYWMAWGFVTP